MPQFAFTPGRFAPVVEIVAPDTYPDFYDNTVKEEYHEPTFNSAGVEELVMISDDVPNCFEDAVLDAPIPVVTRNTELLCSTGSLFSLESVTVYGCTCFLDAFNVLKVPDRRAVLERIKTHHCETCPLCTSVRQPWYNFHVWLASFGPVRNPNDTLPRSASRLPKHPRCKEFRFLAPHGTENPWIDKHIADFPSVESFPVLSRDWLARRRRHLDRPS